MKFDFAAADKATYQLPNRTAAWEFMRACEAGSIPAGFPSVDGLNRVQVSIATWQARELADGLAGGVPVAYEFGTGGGVKAPEVPEAMAQQNEAREEIARRRDQADAFVAEVTRPKGLRPATPPDPRGIYDKYMIARIDGTDVPGGKHENCAHFVLDLTHDAHAIPALRAYAADCEATRPALAADLRRILASSSPDLAMVQLINAEGAKAAPAAVEAAPPKDSAPAGATTEGGGVEGTSTAGRGAPPSSPRSHASAG